MEEIELKFEPGDQVLTKWGEYATVVYDPETPDHHLPLLFIENGMESYVPISLCGKVCND